MTLCGFLTKAASRGDRPDKLPGADDVYFTVASGAAYHFGQIEGLGGWNGASSPLLPGLPTVAATGLPGSRKAFAAVPVMSKVALRLLPSTIWQGRRDLTGRGDPLSHPESHPPSNDATTQHIRAVVA